MIPRFDNEMDCMNAFRAAYNYAKCSDPKIRLFRSVFQHNYPFLTLEMTDCEIEHVMADFRIIKKAVDHVADRILDDYIAAFDLSDQIKKITK